MSEFICFSVPGYVGCFPNTNTDLIEIRNNMTIQKCLELCRQKRTIYAVLRARNTCRCQNGTFLDENKKDDSECNIPCIGDGNDICGGRGKGQERISVYEG